MATFSWRFVERPFRRAQGAAATPGASESLLLAVPRRGLGAALAAAAILIFCGSTFQTSKGAPWRLAGLLPEGTEERNKPWQCQKHALNFMECHGSATAKANPDERVVIWGDSHTPPYLGPLSQISPAFTAFYYPGCVPVLNATWVESSGRILFPTCDASKSEMIEKIRALKPTLIVVAARWGNFAGSPYGQEKRAYAFFVRDRKDPLTVERSLEVLEAGLRETLKALSSTGAPILIAAQVPEMTRHIPDCDVASRRFGFDATSCEKMPRSAVEARQMRINPILKKVAAEFPNVSIFWPAEVLCDQAYCYAKRNGQILYADGDHLSDEGGMLLKDALSAAMQKAVGAPKSVEIATHGDVTRSQ
jgi:hypothetical protein